ncbi:MAG: IS3 family transposase [Clostridiaceae bacterium]
MTYFDTKKELINAIKGYIYCYNNERFQCKLNNRTPIEFKWAA